MPMISHKTFCNNNLNFIKIFINIVNIILLLRTAPRNLFLCVFDNIIILLNLIISLFILILNLYLYLFLLYIILILWLIVAYINLIFLRILLTVASLKLIFLILLLTVASLKLIFLLLFVILSDLHRINTLFLFIKYVRFKKLFFKVIQKKTRKISGLHGRGEAENFTLTGLLTSSTKTSTKLVSRTKIYISLRNYPGGLVKVKSFTVLPQNVRDMLNYNISIKKAFQYLNLLVADTDIFVFKNLKTKSIHNFLNKEKNIICGSTNISYMSKKAVETKYEHPVNVDETFKGITSFLFDNGIPGTPLFKLYVLERSGLNINCTRGCIFQYVINNINSFGDVDTKAAVNNLIVEHLYGKADLNFITEIRAALRFNQYFEYCKKELESIESNTLILAHKNTKANEIQTSINHTGQKNSDLILEYYLDKQKYIIYIDIKQKVLNADDFSYYRIKLLYICREYNVSPYDCIEIQKAYIKSYLLNLQNKLNVVDNDPEMFKFYNKLNQNSDNPLLYTQLINQINLFTLTHVHKDENQTSIIIEENVYISSVHKEMMASISEEDAKKVNAEDFELKNAIRFKQKQEVFLKSPSGITLKERLKTQAAENSFKAIKAWASPYNNNKNNFLDDNINDT